MSREWSVEPPTMEAQQDSGRSLDHYPSPALVGRRFENRTSMRSTSATADLGLAPGESGTADRGTETRLSRERVYPVLN